MALYTVFTTDVTCLHCCHLHNNQVNVACAGAAYKSSSCSRQQRYSSIRGGSCAVCSLIAKRVLVCVASDVWKINVVCLWISVI